ncbi:MAG: S9 family peptidase, partial [Chitinophagaceae bacterium]|nr:S9 family peptidase [Chitinophagaceae bacterium]
SGDKIRFEITPINRHGERRSFYESGEGIVLTAVNMENKENGFYRLSFGEHPRLELLYMGPYKFFWGGLRYGYTLSGGRYSDGYQPLKARDADTWLVIKQSSTEAPNCFISKGLKTFTPLTQLQPYEDYNWLHSELINFKQQDGSPSKGILYKPENFDSSKKYPVLINYYEQFTMGLHQFLSVGYTPSAFINIPWFVSRGYLVFLPDIYFNKENDDTKIAHGAAALNTVNGAANYLASLPYVDSARIGIAGHSTAGGLTNYILTHSNRFAAVFEGAGVSDWVSSALQLNYRDGTSRLGASWYSGPTGSDIWTNNTKYLDNPILHVGKVSSPLLMFHCKSDGPVPFEQAVELFIAMRRMDKKAWLLQYDEGDHVQMNFRDEKDLTIRVTQFFDHYLKGSPPPVWMTSGVRAQLKGIETGLELDLSGRQP